MMLMIVNMENNILELMDKYLLNCIFVEIHSVHDYNTVINTHSKSLKTAKNARLVQLHNHATIQGFKTGRHDTKENLLNK